MLSCIECNDVLFIGEVVGCTPGDGDQWEIDVKGRTDIDAGTRRKIAGGRNRAGGLS